MSFLSMEVPPTETFQVALLLRLDILDGVAAPVGALAYRRLSVMLSS